MRRMLLLVILAIVPAQPLTAADWYTKAVKSVTATFEPAEAKPGETVTFKLTVDLNEGYHTYPLVQVENDAKIFVNTITFPTTTSVVFVGSALDPTKLPTKRENLNPTDPKSLTTYSYCPGSVTYTRKAVVSPKATPGGTKASAELRLSVCDKDNCFPPKTVPAEATLKVLEGPAVGVAKEYAAEVEKALAGK